MRPEQIPYGVKDFKRIRLEDFYYVDKTAFIRKLEARANFLFFVRPRRFGKSLLCETLRCYYDVAEKGNFDRLFGGLDIGRDPTANASRYFVLSLDFSQVNVCTGKTWADKFGAYMDQQLDAFITEHEAFVGDMPDIKAVRHRPGAAEKFSAVVAAARLLGLGVYVIVDEYDNFTNEIVSTAGKVPY
ncbi:MAG: AAA family ATPase, partial [bacterium]|nr:AAA family ATPase [bacterium]